MLVDQTVTYLEMTSPDQLLAASMPPAGVTLDSVDATALALIRATHDWIAAPHHWSSLEWSEQQWSDLLSRPGIGVDRVWLHTSSFDHPHALGNYRNRGFRPFRVESSTDRARYRGWDK